MWMEGCKKRHFSVVQQSDCTKLLIYKIMMWDSTKFQCPSVLNFHFNCFPGMWEIQRLQSYICLLESKPYWTQWEFLSRTCNEIGLCYVQSGLIGIFQHFHEDSCQMLISDFLPVLRQQEQIHCWKSNLLRLCGKLDLEVDLSRILWANTFSSLTGMSMKKVPFHQASSGHTKVSECSCKKNLHMFKSM